LRGVYGSCCGREGREETADAPTDNLSADPQISINVVFASVTSVSTMAEIPASEPTELPPDVIGKRRRAGEYLSSALFPFVLENVKNVKNKLCICVYAPETVGFGFVIEFGFDTSGRHEEN
jgi:hypothetical protein